MTGHDHRFELGGDHHPHGRTRRVLHRLLPPRQRVKWTALRRGLHRIVRRKWVRRSLIGVLTAVLLLSVTLGALWWRLSTGPIDFGIATAWLKTAIQDNIGPNYRITIGGTQLERDERGHPSLRILDIVARDQDGALVASAPKAEIGLSVTSLLSGQLRASSLNLVGAELFVRIEADGQVSISAGSDSKPLARSLLPVPAVPPVAAPAAPRSSSPVQHNFADLAAALAWLDKVGATGLDGYDLRQLGLKNGNLTVDDSRNGKRWNFTGITVIMSRPELGGIIFRLGSESPERPWDISAAIRPLEGGIRAVGIEARRVSVRDLLFAMRVEGIDADIPLSASFRAEISTDGTLQAARGQLIAEKGLIRNQDRSDTDIHLERGEFRIGWDARERVLLMPFQLQADGVQMTMVARIEPDRDGSGVWKMAMSRSDPVIDPIILPPGSEPGSESVALNRVMINARIDTAQRRIHLDQGDIGRQDVRASHNLGVAVTGTLDYSGEEPRVNFGVAATRMPVTVMKRLWPKLVAPKVRFWVNNHMHGGTIERLLIAGNVSVPVLLKPGVPIPDEAISVEIDSSGTAMRPVEVLPEIRDADLSVKVSGRTASVALGRGTIEVGGGYRLNIAGGQFSVPDTHPKGAPAKAVFRVDGTVPAAAALLANEKMRRIASLTLDPATSRGTMSAQVTLDLTLTANPDDSTLQYAMAIDLTNFTAERLLLGQKIEAAALRVNANSKGYSLKGDVKINGNPAALDFRKSGDAAEAELRLQANLDEAARRRMGIDFGAAVVGSIPVKVSGQIRPEESNVKLAVEADFTPAKIENLLPGWVKPQGRAARATFTLVKDGKTTKFQDLAIDGQGALARGSVELDGDGDLISANFPVFGLSDGDKASLRADRIGEGVLRVTMRGDVYDGRAFVKSSMANTGPEKGKQKSQDIDLDIKIGAVAGFNGEALRGLELKLNRRGGRIRSFVLHAKIGRDTPLIGDLRLRPRDNNQVIYIETDDAGSLFRFTDTYPRMFAGQMWVAMDPPTADGAAQVGVLNIRNFVVRDEKGLERVVSGVPDGARSAVEFSELRADFTRLPGRMLIRDGIVRGPLIGATIDGQIDYTTNDMRLRGTFVPLYAINNIFGQIPIVGLFLGGGSREGLLGINYEASGSPSAPRIAVNPISAVAPGLLRKLLPAPGVFDPNYVQPTR